MVHLGIHTLLKRFGGDMLILNDFIREDYLSREQHTITATTLWLYLVILFLLPPNKFKKKDLFQRKGMMSYLLPQLTKMKGSTGTCQ